MIDLIKNFVAIDFETSYGSIPCSIGIVEFLDGKPQSEYYSLIKPIDLKFSPINSRINGIYLDDVINEREFDELWYEIENYFHNKNIVAHNASTDISVLEKTLKHYNIPSPIYKSFCTLNITKSFCDLENYKLSTIAKHFDLEQKNYHNALDDALVCGKLFTLIHEHSFEYNYLERNRRERKTSNLKNHFINRQKILENNSSTLEGKTFLFTGKLSLFTREQAEIMVEQHGGKNISAVSKNLNYLVVGEKAGSKLKKAEALGSVVILDEQQFLDLVK